MTGGPVAAGAPGVSLARAHEGGTVTARLRRRPAHDRAAAVSVGLVHGLGATEAVWDQLAGLLPAEVGVWTLGLPWDCVQGYQWALRWPPRAWLERALALLPKPPDVLVAHSFSANVLLDLLCADRDDRVDGKGSYRGLVLISPFYRPTPDAFDWALISHYLNDFTDLLRESVLAQRQGNGHQRGQSQEYAQDIALRVRDRIGSYGWLRFFELFSATPLLNLTAVTMPCLVIGGATDTASYPRDCAQLAAALPHARAEILPGTGHFTMLDDPRSTAAYITRFLRGKHLAADPRGQGATREGAAR